MEHNIEAIFLDVGNTLRFLLKDEQHQAAARQKIASLVGTQEPADAFCERLDARYKTYRKWAFETLLEAPEKELWTRWLLPDYPSQQIAPLAPELTFQYRQSMGRRIPIQDGKQTIIELSRRGYILGIISNLITAREIPDWLEAEGLTQYFKAVVLSSVFGRRKPDPAIFHEAARIAGVEPEHSVYVGDNPTRDVIGTRRANFGMVILMLDSENSTKQIDEENKPDLVIRTLGDLLDHFPPRQG